MNLKKKKKIGCGHVRHCFYWHIYLFNVLGVNEAGHWSISLFNLLGVEEVSHWRM